MDRIAKLLRKLSGNERERLEGVLALLLSGKTRGLDIKKLRGAEDIYRVRVGTIRIIFLKNKGDIRVLEVSRRSEDTYGRLP